MSYPTFGDDWRKRWVQLGNSAKLHRVASTVVYTEEQIQAERDKLHDKSLAKYVDDWDVDGLCPRGIEGTTACGRSGRLDMPGIFSRMGAPRCKQCCKKVGIPAGKGAPANDKTLTEEQRND
jgi:hypothetical protein